MGVVLEARNFGAIEQAVVELGRLTMFMGPNNTGKSTLATLAYAVTHQTPWKFPPGRISYRRGTGEELVIRLSSAEPNFDKRMLRHAQTDWKSHLDDVNVDLFKSLPDSIVALFSKALKQTLEQYGKSVAADLERAFGSRFKELGHSVGSKIIPPRLVVKNSSPGWVVHIEFDRGRLKINAEVDAFSPPDVERYLHRLGDPKPSRLRRLRMQAPEYSLLELFEQFVAGAFSAFPRQAFYLPAARSGILQSHKALASAIVRRSSLAGIEDMAIPKMSGLVSDFIGQLLTLEPEEKGPFAEIASELESGVLHGQIEISGAAPTYPEISFRDDGGRYPLHRTSSMVSELAPIVLFLRHLVGVDDILVVEEPESHLHPVTQTRFALTLARLLAANARVLVTTHSDFFLAQVNNLIKTHALSATPDSDQAALAINPELVRAYLFCPSAQGTQVKELPVDPIEGISDTQFSEVAEQLYNQSASLSREIQNGT